MPENQPKILIKNRRTYKGPGEYCGRPSPLGNPFTIDSRHGNREEVIAKFRSWLDEQMKTDGDVYRAMLELLKKLLLLPEGGELILICWCEPLDCHLRIIRDKLLEGYRKITLGGLWNDPNVDVSEDLRQAFEILKQRHPANLRHGWWNNG